MELYFLRHGDASPATAGQADAERPVTERGGEETRRVARALGRAGVTFDRVISSPLLRARETSEAVRQVLGIAAPVEGTLPPDTRLGDVQRIVAEGTYRALLFVGHAPTLGEAAGQLVGCSYLALPKSGLARVDADRVEPGEGRLVWLLSPALFPEE